MTTEQELRYQKLLAENKTSEEDPDLTSAILYYLTANKSHTNFLRKREFIFKVLSKKIEERIDRKGDEFINFIYFPQELREKIITKHREDSANDRKNQIQDLVDEMDKIWEL